MLLPLRYLKLYTPLNDKLRILSMHSSPGTLDYSISQIRYCRARKIRGFEKYFYTKIELTFVYE